MPIPFTLSPIPCLYSSGTKSADFLNISPGARPAGLGGAFVAIADETSGMFYNPAGLAFSMSPELQLMYSPWLGELNYSYAGYSHPTPAGTFGLAAQYLSAPSTVRIVDGVKSGEFAYYDGAVNLLYAVRMGENSSIGINLKNVASLIDTSILSAFSGDAGLMFRTTEEGFAFGISAQNLFGQSGEEKLPLSGKAGIALKASLPEHYSDVLLTLEAGQSEYGPLYYTAAVEHWGAKTLGLRAGYKFIADEKQRQSIGTPLNAGISLRIKNIAIDYAYQPFAALGTAHQISLTVRTFGWQAKWRTVNAQIKADPDIFSPNNNGAKDSVFFVPQIPEIKDIKTWELYILDNDKKPVKKFTGKDLLPKILSWEGQTDAGGQVSEGKYLYTFMAEGDGRKRAKSETGEIIADLTAPSVTLNISTPSFSPDGDGLDDNATFYISALDDFGIDQWQLTIMNDLRKPIKIIKSTSSVQSEIVWNGTDDYYGAVVPSGNYEARLIVWDIAGNKTIVTSNVKVNIPPKVEVKEIVKEVQVKEEKRGLVVNLSSQILFGVGKSIIRSEAFSSLDEVVNLVQAYPENDIVIEGHSDSTGSRGKNIDLSSARAWAIYSYLVKHGVQPSRLKAKGFGPDNPVASNRTPQGRAKNRRVEIIILKK